MNAWPIRGRLNGVEQEVDQNLEHRSFGGDDPQPPDTLDVDRVTGLSNRRDRSRLSQRSIEIDFNGGGVHVRCSGEGLQSLDE